MTRALTFPEMVKQRPCATSEIKTRLPDSMVSYSSVVDTGDDQSSLHCAVTSTGALSDHIGV